MLFRLIKKQKDIIDGKENGYMVFINGVIFNSNYKRLEGFFS
jgi:hypothetical protein